MARSWDDAIDLIDQQRMNDSGLIQRMLAIKAHYNAEVVVPTYDVAGEAANEMMSPSPLLIADAIDKNAMRAASITPSISVQSFGNTDAERKRKRRRREALHSVWHESAISDALLGRAFRHLFAYGTGSCMAVYNSKNQTPLIQLRDPLATYSENKAVEDFSPPLFMAHVYGRSGEWVMKYFPEATEIIKGYGNTIDLWDIAEFTDEDQVMIGIMGPRPNFLYSSSDYLSWRQSNRDLRMMLRRYNNWAGVVPGYTMRRVTLDRIESSVMKLTGHVNEIGRMRRLEMIAAERAVFPDMVAFGDGEPPVLVGGVWKDGRDGELNTIMNARGFQTFRTDPSVNSRQVTDMMEGAFVQSSGLDPLSLGHSRQSLRTGQALNAMAGFSLEPQIMEAQKTVARMLTVVNEGLLELWKNHPKLRNKKVSLFTGRSGESEMIDFTPAKDITSSKNVVSYPMPGADINSIQVALGQAMQTNQMSTATARKVNPLIVNEEFEERQLKFEQIEAAVLQAFLAQATNPESGGTLVDMAEILEQFQKHGDIGRAIKEADRLARERQANAQPNPEQMVPGLDPGNPGAMAGGAPPFAGPTSRGNDLQRIMRNLNARPTDRNALATPAGA